MPLYKRPTPPRRTRVCVCSLSLTLSLSHDACLGFSHLSASLSSSPLASIPHPASLASRLVGPTRLLGSTSSCRLGPRLAVALVSARRFHSRASRLPALPQPSSTPAPLPPSPLRHPAAEFPPLKNDRHPLVPRRPCVEAAISSRDRRPLLLASCVPSARRRA